MAGAAAAGASAAAAAVVAAGHNSRRHSADLPAVAADHSSRKHSAGLPAVAAGHNSLHTLADRTVGYRSLEPVAHTALAVLAAAADVGGTVNVMLHLAFHLTFRKVVRKKDSVGELELEQNQKSLILL